VSFEGSTGDEPISTGFANDTPNGGADKDVLGEADGNDSMDSRNGDDRVAGTTGNDSISGGAGNNTIDSGAGDDLIFASACADVTVHNAGDGADTVGVEVLADGDRLQL
jgi:Ca2+-binding RTX toxin-like protein